MPKIHASPYNGLVSREGSGRRSEGGRELRRQILRRRRKFALCLLLIVIAGLYYLWALHFSGRMVLFREAGAEEVTRGALFGPFYLPGGATNLYAYRTLVPVSSSPWETKVELLDSNMLVIHPQTDFILTGAAGFHPQATYARTSTFRLRTGGYYFLRFTQVNGTYAGSTASLEGGASAPPVMSFLVKADVVRGWQLWVPLALIALAFLAVVIMI